MTRRTTHRTAPAGPIDLGRARRRRATETGPGDSLPQSLARLVDSVATRWRGHEPEIAILSATTLMLAVAALFAGADPLFTFMLAMVAAITIWSPWRQSE